MGNNSEKKQSTTPVIPSYLQGPLTDYTKAVAALGTKNPQGYVSPASSLQNQAFARTARLGGGTYRPMTGQGTAASTGQGGGVLGVGGGASTGGAAATGATGGGLFAGLGVTPMSIYGNTDVVAGAGDRYTYNQLSDANDGGQFGEGETGGGLDIASKVGLPADPVSNYISKAVGHDITDPLDLRKRLGIGERSKDSTNLWGTIDQNAQDASAYDYQRYWNDNPDVQQHFSTLQKKDQRGYDHALKSYDLNGDGQLSPAEAGQWHWEQAGQKEGRQIMTPEQSMALDEAMRANDTGGGFLDDGSMVSGGMDGYLGSTDGLSPMIDAQGLFGAATGLVGRAANTDVRYRTFDQFDPETYYNPYEKEVVDATGAYFDEQLAGQISANQARATQAGAYGGSRHGVADAELMRTSANDRAKMMADLRYQGYETARGQFNQDSQGLFSQDMANRDNLYNAANALGNIATSATQTEIATIQQLLQAGEVERAIDTAVRTGDLTLLSTMGSMLGFNASNMFGQQTTAPGNNRVMTGVGGAATGYQVGGPWGAVIGGALGYLGG